MRRIGIPHRKGWLQRVKDIGVNTKVSPTNPQWCEEANVPHYYEMAASEKYLLDLATNVVAGKIQETLEWLLGKDSPITYAEKAMWLGGRLGMNMNEQNLVTKSWQSKESSVASLYNFVMVSGTPKLVEISSNPYKHILAASLGQWDWYLDGSADIAFDIGADQFNDIHDQMSHALREKAKECRSSGLVAIHNNGDKQDVETCEYILELCPEGEDGRVDSFSTDTFPAEAIGWDGDFYVDPRNEQIPLMFSMSSWFELMKSHHTPTLTKTSTKFAEPAWTLVSSNRMFLALLYQRHPECEYLTETYHSKIEARDKFPNLSFIITKQRYGELGGGLELLFRNNSGRIVDHDKKPATSKWPSPSVIYQKYHNCTTYNGYVPTFHSYHINGESAGLYITEHLRGISKSNHKTIAPHIFYPIGGNKK